MPGLAALSFAYSTFPPDRAVFRPVLSRLTPVAQWALILPASALLAWLLWIAGLPAALLLGPMAAGIAGGLCGLTVRVRTIPYTAAQAALGCMIAGSLSPSIVGTFLRYGLLFVAMVLATIVASVIMGWFLARWRVVPGTTGLWGTSAGAASAMVVLADAYGADVRLVAFMQYLRVVSVALAASLVAGLWGGKAAMDRSAVVWFPALHLGDMLGILALVGLGMAAGRLRKFPSGALVTPMVVGALLHAFGLVNIAMPEWMLALTYAGIGWRIGLAFTRESLRHAARALPLILLSILLLIAFCGGLAFLLTRIVGADPLTAYLATSPGGLDTVAIIAAGAEGVDMPFVMSMQTVRLFLVVLTGPPLARAMADATERSRRCPPGGR